MIAFLGTSFAAQHLKAAAIRRGVPVTESLTEAAVVFVAEDTPVAPDGKRDLTIIHDYLAIATATAKPIVLTSQVPPGFTRALGIKHIWHQAETLRVKDAEYRALNPDYIAVGGAAPLPPAYAEYLAAFDCPILRMSWEDAEFSKIAVNMTLASQVDNANRLAAAAERYGVDWESVALALKNDKRIGKESYLTPGRWQDSKHLLRDWHTLQGLATEEAASTS